MINNIVTFSYPEKNKMVYYNGLKATNESSLQNTKINR